MFEKLVDVKNRYDEINQLLMDPTVINDNKRYKDLMREYKNLTPIVEKFDEYTTAKNNFEEAKEMLAESHEETMKLAEKFTNDELFSKGVYKWVGTSTLGSFFVCNTSSHYNWALKKLKAHRRNCK